MKNPTPPKRERFWKRQFSATITGWQKIFDVIVGVVIPILLLIFDPVVFRSGGTCLGPILGGYAIFGYLAIGIGFLALISWLFVDAVKHSGAAFIAGILRTGGFFAAGVGLVIAPFSVLGLIAVVGVLGFFPFLTSFVYFRNGTRALRAAASLSTSGTRFIVNLIAGAVFVIGVPALAQVEISSIIQHSVDAIVATPNVSNQSVLVELDTVNQLCLTLCTSTISLAFDSAASANPDQQLRLTTLYKQITGAELVSSSCSSGSE